MIDDCVMAGGCGPTLPTCVPVFSACVPLCTLACLQFRPCSSPSPVVLLWMMVTGEDLRGKELCFLSYNPFLLKNYFYFGSVAGYFVICIKYVTVPPKILFIKQLKNPTILYSYVT